MPAFPGVITQVDPDQVSGQYGLLNLGVDPTCVELVEDRGAVIVAIMNDTLRAQIDCRTSLSVSLKAIRYHLPKWCSAINVIWRYAVSWQGKII